MRTITSVTIVLACGMLLAGAVAPVRAQTYKQVYTFRGGRHGSRPYAGLIAFHGKLFGTTAFGGSHNCNNPGCGTVFSLDPATGKEKTIYVFQGGNDGAQPFYTMTIVGNLLYGATAHGGAANAGTVFSIDPRTHAEKILYAFQGGNDGSDPSSSLLDVAGTLYGVTGDGGLGNAGTIFSIDAATGAEKIVYAFHGNLDGYEPDGGVTDVNGVLYGTTSGGGASGFGTVFSIDPATGRETILHSFGTRRKDGIVPSGALTAVGDKLYGTTSEGGTDDDGTVFWINPATGIENVAYSFAFRSNSKDGSMPGAGLTKVGGILYGTTFAGGANENCRSCGTVFAFDAATKTETILHAFQGGDDGEYPSASLTDVRGTLYGTTIEGGTAGTVFEITP